MTAGYYKVDNNELLYGLTVNLPGGIELNEENHDEHTYPVQGWTWYESKLEAWLGENFAPPMDTADIALLDGIYDSLTPSGKIKVARIKRESQEFAG